MTNRVLLWPNFGAEEGEPAALRAQLAPLVQAWALLFEGDVEADGATLERPAWCASVGRPLPQLAAMAGLVPWLATEAARRNAEARGLRWTGPSPEAVTTVSDKGWAHRAALDAGMVPADLAEMITVLDAETLTAEAIAIALSRWPAQAQRSWTLKPRFGSSARGRARGSGAGLDNLASRSLPRLRRRGGILLEPWLDRIDDLSVQLFIDAAGEVEILGTLRQDLTTAGAYRGNAGVMDVSGRVNCGVGGNSEATLRDCALVIGTRAAAAGLRGPAGIDAFVYRGDSNQQVLRPCVEVNARTTTGFVALGVLQRVCKTENLRGPLQWRFCMAREAVPPTWSVRAVSDAGPWLAWEGLCQVNSLRGTMSG
jgi:hypothetical protein